MGKRDLTRRFVVIFHGSPVDSFDDEVDARRRMAELRDTQLRAWQQHWPFAKCDNSALWCIQDKAKMTA